MSLLSGLHYFRGETHCHLSRYSTVGGNASFLADCFQEVLLSLVVRNLSLGVDFLGFSYLGFIQLLDFFDLCLSPSMGNFVVISFL